MSNTTEPTPQKTPTATDNVVDAASALFDQVVKVFQDSDFQSAFAVATAHGLRLDKMPKLDVEMNALSQALKAWKQEKPLAPVVPFEPRSPKAPVETQAQ